MPLVMVCVILCAQLVSSFFPEQYVLYRVVARGLIKIRQSHFRLPLLQTERYADSATKYPWDLQVAARGSDQADDWLGRWASLVRVAYAIHDGIG